MCGFVHIAEALKSNHALKKLELADCRQTEKGLTVLSASLVLNKCLQYLDIATKYKSWSKQTVLRHSLLFLFNWQYTCRPEKLEGICVKFARESPSYKAHTWTSKKCSIQEGYSWRWKVSFESGSKRQMSLRAKDSLANVFTSRVADSIFSVSACICTVQVFMYETAENIHYVSWDGQAPNLDCFITAGEG